MNIVFVGLSGVPYARRAIDTRLLSFTNLFTSSNHDVVILNRYSALKPNWEYDAQFIDDRVSVIELCNLKGIPKCMSKFLLIYTIIIEFWKLIFLNKKKKIDVLHVASGHFIDIFYYVIIARCIGAKVVYHYCEYRSSFKSRNVYHRINGKLINCYAPKFWDGAICISHFLVSKTKEVNKFIKIIQIPPICDYDYFDHIICEKEASPYLLFCGYTSYSEIIYMIIDAYNKSRIKEVASLKMVINGNPVVISEIRRYCPKMEILQNLKYTDLISMFKGALALFIPLRNTIQDIARFPNKICEYTACHGVVVTTRYGEIPYYFEDKINALIADDFNVASIAEQLDWLYDNMDQTARIKKNSYLLGRRVFNLISYKDSVTEFLKEL